MICSAQWETMAEICSRTGGKAEDVIDQVKAEVRSRKAVCRFPKDRSVIEFRAKEPKA